MLTYMPAEQREQLMATIVPLVRNSGLFGHP